MANTKEFFKTKKAWSVYKDELLCSYIQPYFNKVMSTGVPIVYIDGFAGKGKFDDGTKGSPLLVKEKLYQAKSISNFATPISAYFVEYEYADELKSNLCDDSLHVVQGDYRVKVKEILDNNQKKNIFLYVDPYGIKYLDFGIFANLDTTKYKSVELLLNLNSFGFLRED
ncbi:MAG: three-Cys-motif partner protein TcmP [Eubacteriales bacterium]|nr:three-Cys-motif partner protein TcmP [Eubacteriales bacterium]